ncbi:E3 ubiquitin-protein ligase TRIM35 [Astyanax mexicanus]|uniref:Tripartite motif containing 35-12 n=1 Tax=Astyanax mexicanus TaxID=7994 RepID=W5K9W3_ASTMX|nr:E3 ubiquitin-protein ligase TRIM35 [Astyanax mexicanus]
MASRPSLTEEDFSCPLCCEIFRDPILLACSHSMCKGCVRKFWDQRGALECPICRTVSSNSEPPTNIVLRNMCEAVLKEKNRRFSVEMEGFCSLHQEPLTIFCHKEQRPICTRCKDSSLHIKHSFCSIQDASEHLKQELQKKIKPLNEKLKIYEDSKQPYEKMAEYIKKQAQHTEALIKREFEKLHHFLWDEEASRIAALRKEEEQRSQTVKKNIEKIQTQISQILDTIKVIEKEMAAEDLQFLLNYKASVERTQAKLDSPETFSGVLINVAKHLSNLGFQVSEKLHGSIQYTPVVLDPNTAHADLVVSDDLLTMAYKGLPQDLPANPERFAGFAMALGSVGYISGTHSWEVEVGENTSWAVGVITESVHMHRENLSRSGLWYVGFSNGKYGKGYSPENLSVMRVGEKVQRIRVQLDLDKGRLTFTDSGRNTCLHVFKQAFHERVFPYFYSHCKLHPLRILPGQSSVKIHMPS